ncbi:hypothetical protein CY34DRAFT_111115 [Suillus luteus UH-Slu-Lm8-n1]|uniref:Unplaced genomic scaffold CY34scaffold_1289, whole genome shotgun sequence n=1 Tax=Suillus luteus UH-Slu-Lm8-n1 TaxID=930992 RepID=A0A0C9ZS15_9AGAM|nr:hypothetical protein CY34DRAFT_111115 [Suillus luteus UH-Slu-Lm8-n1]
MSTGIMPLPLGYRDSVESVESGGTFGHGPGPGQPTFVPPTIEVQLATTIYQDRLLSGRIEYLAIKLSEVETSITSLRNSQTTHATRLLTHSHSLNDQRQDISDIQGLHAEMQAMEKRLNDKFDNLSSTLKEMSASNGTFFTRILDAFKSFNR